MFKFIRMYLCNGVEFVVWHLEVLRENADLALHGFLHDVVLLLQRFC